MSKSSDERYTPEWLHQPIVNALGGVCHLDPTSNNAKSFPAVEHITAKEDCFEVDWSLRLPDCSGLPDFCNTVYMNPPYSNAHLFLQHLHLYLELGAVNKAITLTLAGALSNKKTRPLLLTDYFCGAVHPHGRVNFDNSGDSNDRDVVFMLWGEFDYLECAHFANSINGLFMANSIKVW